MYTSSLEAYDIVPETERELYGQQVSSIRDISKRRELKIRQYKNEKDLRTRIEVIKRRRRKLVSEDLSFGDFDIVASLLLPEEEEDEDEELDTILRATTLLLLRLFYAQARAQLEAVDQEIHLLRNAVGPPMSQLPNLPADERQSKTREQEDMWRIDTLSETSNRGPLLDSHGKPLRPFTILPASESDRARLHAQVFGPGHRLPTMTINEYLEIERQRGGILPAKENVSEMEPTSSEQLTIESEMDGRVLGDLKAEEKRHNDEQWAQYKDTHPKGAGNTMNRG
ncbi:TAP42-like protein [Chiua virens]|nr:TAP42-like protein [Chiua virens]